MYPCLSVCFGITALFFGKYCGLVLLSVIMLDEAHERSLQTDMSLGLMKKILKKRKDLRVIISSATLDAQVLFNFFDIKLYVHTNN